MLAAILTNFFVLCIVPKITFAITVFSSLCKQTDHDGTYQACNSNDCFHNSNNMVPAAAINNLTGSAANTGSVIFYSPFPNYRSGEIIYFPFALSSGVLNISFSLSRPQTSYTILLSSVCQNQSNLMLFLRIWINIRCF